MDWVQKDEKRVQMDEKRVQMDEKRVQMDEKRVQMDERKIQMDEKRIEKDGMTVQMEEKRVQMNEKRIQWERKDGFGGGFRSFGSIALRFLAEFPFGSALWKNRRAFALQSSQASRFAPLSLDSKRARLDLRKVLHLTASFRIFDLSVPRIPTLFPLFRSRFVH